MFLNQTCHNRKIHYIIHLTNLLQPFYNMIENHKIQYSGSISNYLDHNYFWSQVREEISVLDIDSHLS